MKYYFIILLFVAVTVAPWMAKYYPIQLSEFIAVVESIPSQIASVVLAHDPKTIDEIQGRYKDTTPEVKVRVLLVPGHEPGYGGTENNNLKEREIAVELSSYLADMLYRNNKYNVYVTRNNNDWNPIFKQYFESNWNDIVAWIDASWKEERRLISLGHKTQSVPKVYHNKAKKGVAERLYGITKWANENDIDITIHIHFNDYPGRREGETGKYSGFAIYVPEKQYYNSTTTVTIANHILRRISKYNPVSDLAGENDGLIEDADLIAVGANNTANSASLLIEYGYIGEPQLNDINTRSIAIKDLAFQTYLGLQDFFQSKAETPFFYDTMVLPHYFDSDFEANRFSTKEVFALQTILTTEGIYPPVGRDKNDCLRTGNFGPCTKEALSIFQNRYNITGEKNKVGPKTRSELNKKYSIKPI